MLYSANRLYLRLCRDEGDPSSTLPLPLPPAPLSDAVSALPFHPHLWRCGDKERWHLGRAFLHMMGQTVLNHVCGGRRERTKTKRSSHGHSTIPINQI